MRSSYDEDREYFNEILKEVTEGWATLRSASPQSYCYPLPSHSPKRASVRFSQHFQGALQPVSDHATSTSQVQRVVSD